MNETRLLTLAKALETRVPPERFDLRQWRTDMAGDAQPMGCNVSDSELQQDCGTAGCAVGWACALPEFKAEGLTWNSKSSGPGLMRQGEVDPVLSSWNAVDIFFGLSDEESAYLFSPVTYDVGDDPLLVASRIRQFVADGQIPSTF